MNAAAHSPGQMHELAGEVRARAMGLGFELVGIGPAEESKYAQYLRKWLDGGRHGTMQWLERRFEERVDVRRYLPGAQSVICVAMNYNVELRPVPAGQEQHQGRVGRYALGEDYHLVIKKRLYELADWLRQCRPEAQTKCAVDTAPVMEKELAQRAGLGWIGKNTCLINPQIGSWLLLGEIVTTLALPADEPGTDRCGTCRRCIEACPTGAITGPYELDARRCISYLTIEHRGDLDTQQRGMLGEWLYGCDICQEVCPWNSKAPFSEVPAVAPRFETGSIDRREVRAWTEQDYRARLRGSAMKRVKLAVLKANAGQ